MKNISLNKSIRESGQSEYVLKLKKKRGFPWWILVFLLIPLLFIKCHKDITVTCIDDDTETVIEGAKVNIKYTAHFLHDEGTFLKDSLINLTQLTDSMGKAVFKDVPFSVYSCIAYMVSKIDIFATDDCHEPASENKWFHPLFSTTIRMKPKKDNVCVKLVDLNTGQPLPDATAYFSSIRNGKQITDSAKTDINGIVRLNGVPSCSVFESIKGSCYGYADTTKVNVPVDDINDAINPPIMKLRPLYEGIEFQTRDEHCDSLLPGCVLNITGSVSGPIPPKNSGSGIFMVFARQNENLTIEVSKPGYISNNYTVKNIPVATLMKNIQSRRLALRIQSAPAGGAPIEHAFGDNGYHIRRYKFNKENGQAIVECDFDAAEDSIRIYSGACATNQNLAFEGYFNYEKSIPINFVDSMITVVMYGATHWKYSVSE